MAPESPGVFVLWRGRDSLYVGETTKPRHRLLESIERDPPPPAEPVPSEFGFEVIEAGEVGRRDGLSWPNSSVWLWSAAGGARYTATRRFVQLQQQVGITLNHSTSRDVTIVVSQKCPRWILHRDAIGLPPGPVAQTIKVLALS